MRSAIFISILSSALAQACFADDSLTLLTNGKDLRNFDTKGNWLVKPDGVIALEPRDGEEGWTRYESYLWLKKPYADFEIELEYNLPPDGNSGLYFRCADKIDPTQRGIEIQIKDSHGQEKLGHHDGGGVYPDLRTFKKHEQACGAMELAKSEVPRQPIGCTLERRKDSGRPAR